MKIIRDGKEFELTANELIGAYMEQEHIYNIQDIDFEQDSRIGCDDETDEIVCRIRNNAEMMSDIADEKRRMMDDDGIRWDCAVEEAVNAAIAKLKSA